MHKYTGWVKPTRIKNGHTDPLYGMVIPSEMRKALKVGGFTVPYATIYTICA